MESPVSADQCAISRLLLENVLSGGTLEAGEIRICEIAGCTGAAVLRQSPNVKGSLIPVFGNPDGTRRDDNCPIVEGWVAEAEAGEAALLRALREKETPNP
jgi:hypothetical protein